MTPDVANAVEEVKAAFPGHQVDVTPEAQGGAYVVVHGLPVGASYAPAHTWVGFLVSFLYPHADVYPHFVDGSLRKGSGAPHGVGITGPTAWNGRSALQVSRRSNRWNPATDTAALKLAKVLEWLRSQ